jgi:FMN phosphatase YigB (HAD superfamily)
MIHHISIAAHDPQHVAEVLAELFQGTTAPWASHPGSYVAVAFDFHGTLVEVHPLTIKLIPGVGEDAAQHLHDAGSLVYTATHAAISVPISEEQIQAIATREGWRMKRFNRGGFFDVIELWLENHMLIELLPPELVTDYLAFMEPQALKQFLTTAA